MGLSDRLVKNAGKTDVDLTPKIDLEKQEKPPGYVGNIGTNVDKVYNMVLERKSLSLKELAAIFKVSINKVEDWARILDKQGLLELFYPVVGGPMLRVKGGAVVEKPKKANKSKRMLLFFIFSIILVAICIFAIVKIFYK